MIDAYLRGYLSSFDSRFDVRPKHRSLQSAAVVFSAEQISPDREPIAGRRWALFYPAGAWGGGGGRPAAETGPRTDLGGLSVPVTGGQTGRSLVNKLVRSSQSTWRLPLPVRLPATVFPLPTRPARCPNERQIGSHCGLVIWRELSMCGSLTAVGSDVRPVRLLVRDNLHLCFWFLTSLLLLLRFILFSGLSVFLVQHLH